MTATQYRPGTLHYQGTLQIHTITDSGKDSRKTEPLGKHSGLQSDYPSLYTPFRAVFGLVTREDQTMGLERK